MIWQDLALGLAGMIGSVTAVIHATLLQRLMVVPIRNGINEGRLLRGSPTRLVGPLLHFSGFGWLAGGICTDRRSDLAGPRGKSRFGSAGGQPVFIRCNRQYTGNTRSSSRRDFDGPCLCADSIDDRIPSLTAAMSEVCRSTAW